jgi:hypothetical protein
VDEEPEAHANAGGEDRPSLVRVEGAGIDEDETPDGTPGWPDKRRAGSRNLGDGPHRPRSCPHQMPAVVEVTVAELRGAFDVRWVIPFSRHLHGGAG